MDLSVTYQIAVLLQAFSKYNYKHVHVIVKFARIIITYVCTDYGVDPKIFEGYGHRESLFEKNRKKISAMFTKWKCREIRIQYLQSFSISKWKKLPNSMQKRHTLSNCKECAIHHTALQNAFPGKKLALSKDVATTVKKVINAKDETHATREILADLQPLFESQYGHSFIDAVTRLPGSHLQAKPTSVDKRREKRKIQRDCKQEIESHYKQTDALTLLAEGSSMQSYKRLRLSQSFESPKYKRARERVKNSTPKEKKHSPSFENATWDKVKVLEELRTFPIDSIINWSQFAREHCIPGKNNGQVVKEFAEQNGIDTFQMDRRQPGTRMRARKLKMPGKDISVPSHLTPEQIKEDWLQMIQTGELTLGEQCHPCTIQKYHTSNGNVTKTETTVYG